MPLEVKRKEKETMGAFVRRFSRLVQQSGILLRARAIRYYDRPLNKNRRRKAALRRNELTKRYEKQKKLGKTSYDS